MWSSWAFSFSNASTSPTPPSKLDPPSFTPVALAGEFAAAGIGVGVGVPLLFDAMAAHGYGDDLIRKLAHENWLACLDRCLN